MDFDDIDDLLAEEEEVNRENEVYQEEEFADNSVTEGVHYQEELMVSEPQSGIVVEPVIEALNREATRKARRQRRTKGFEKEPESLIISRFLKDQPSANDDVAVLLPNGDMKYLLVQKNHAENLDSLSTILEYQSKGEFTRPMQEIEEEVRNVRKAKNAIMATLAKDVNFHDTCLLVDKYAPNCFTDLVSNERNNREVLKWVQSWKEFVFGSGGEHARPEEKVILLCGPPGAGKSTLARVIARHAGYNPVEVNASEQRTSEVLFERLSGAMEMRSMFQNRKPNCVILDEVEGIANIGQGKGAIHMLLEMINASVVKHRKDDYEEDSDTEKPLKKKNGKRTYPAITRPVILICNDGFAQVLRPLKKFAKVIYMHQASKGKVIQRLQTICNREGVNVQHGALDLLCEKSENDIRGCLHSLQFTIAQTNDKTLRMDAIQAVCSSEKDKSADLMSSWRSFFYHGKPVSEGNRFENDFHKVGGHMSESSKFFEGLHENVSRVALEDSSAFNLSALVDLVGDADILGNVLHSGNNWSLAPYLTACALDFKSKCKTSTKSLVGFPTQAAAFAKKHQESLEILDSFYQNHKVLTCGILSRAAPLYTLTALVDIISPKVRKLPWNLLNGDEKNQLTKTVETMITLGMSFTKIDLDIEEGKVSPDYMTHPRTEYRPLPRIDRLVSFSNQPLKSNHSLVSQSICEILAHRISRATMNAKETNPADFLKSRITHRPTPQNFLTETQDTQVKDFFGRVVTTKKSSRVDALNITQAQNLDEQFNEISKTRKRQPTIVFTFNEGCTNAVRRPVIMEDFLL